MFISRVSKLYFEGEGDTSNTVNADNTGNASPSTFTQDDVNKFLAADRRKHQEQYKTLEGTYQNLLSSRQLADSERERLDQELQALQAQFRTKEQQAEFERKQAATKYEKELKDAQEEAKRWRSAYRDERIDRSLLDAAGSDAFNASQIVNLLRPSTELKEEVDSEGKLTGKMVPMVTFQDVDEKTGAPITTLRTPSDAVKRMKELPQQYGNLFRSNVVSGVGAGNAQASSSSQKIDVTRLSPEQYRKLRAENPAALGLPTRRR